MLHAGLKAGALFLASLLALYILLKTLLPPIDDEHKDRVKLPKTFDELKGLNEVLQVYKSRHYYRVLGCYTTVYLFLQAFSIPGSMYLSILGGAMYGVVMALPLVCFCVATGALLCYAISSALGPAILLNSEKWQRRVDAWTKRIDGHKENLISYLIVLRIAPLPPHWVVNVVAPHLGISIWTFWISTFFGIAGVSYIHTTIGTTLDQMTSSNDFHLISWQNGVGLGGSEWFALSERRDLGAEEEADRFLLPLPLLHHILSSCHPFPLPTPIITSLSRPNSRRRRPSARPPPSSLVQRPRTSRRRRAR
ncbi:snare associated Golgi protein-domain-containing protein [Leucosporidium creatinivorum]|uniref:Snare associated Golgi protein-domain-containing protein n=1 Tax=Leucosporidium creatinivorum TaxID=106004 RepID=A0A1Y2FRL5_9BASI|nr:snare associated Golgi protein-domain-containing protein [Leucosporidium creatinivorum]